MGSHIADGEFQSDKYPTCPAGKVPLSTRDATAQDLLWEYAHRRRAVDMEFTADLQQALRAKGFVPRTHRPSCVDPGFTACGLPLERIPVSRDLQLGPGETCPQCTHVVAQVASRQACVDAMLAEEGRLNGQIQQLMTELVEARAKLAAIPNGIRTAFGKPTAPPLPLSKQIARDIDREMMADTQPVTGPQDLRLVAQGMVRRPDETREVYVVFDGPPGPDGPRFVETEDASGKSVGVGRWVELHGRHHPYWALVLRVPAVEVRR